MIGEGNVNKGNTVNLQERVSQCLLSCEKNLGTAYSTDFDPNTFNQTLDNEAIKLHYQEGLFQSGYNPGRARDFLENGFLLYSGMSYEDVEPLLYSRAITDKIENQQVIFLQSFIDYSQKLRGKKRVLFIEWFMENFLTTSPNMFSYLSGNNQFILLGQMLKDEEYITLRRGCIGELHYNFVGSKQKSLDILLEEICSQGEVMAINSLDLLSIVIKNNGGYSQNELKKNTYYLCEKMKERYDNQFFHYKVDILLKDLDYLTSDNEERASKNELKTTDNAVFEGFNGGEIVKVSSDYASLISNHWYSKTIGKYEWEKELEVTDYEYDLYIFLQNKGFISKNNLIQNSETMSSVGMELYLYLDKLYYESLEEDNTELNKVLEELFGKEEGGELFRIFILSIEWRTIKVDELNNFSDVIKERGQKPLESEEFNKKYEELNDYIRDISSGLTSSLEGKVVNTVETKKKKLLGSSYAGILSQPEIDIFGCTDIKQQEAFLQAMHKPEMMLIIKKDLGVDLSDITLQNQLYLLQFLWQQPRAHYQSFKSSLLSIKGYQEKINFLITFLACSHDMDLGNKLIELALLPGSRDVFKGYADLIRLQGNQGFTKFLKNILLRGEGLLREAYSYGKEKGTLESLILNNKYSDSLVSRGLFIKKLFRESDTEKGISIQEFNESDLGFTLNLVQGGNLIEKTDSVSMMLDDNYQNNYFPKKHFEAIIGWIQEAHEQGDKDFINFALKYMGNDFNNQQSSFLFLEDENSDLAGVCKIQKREDGSFYYGTHYLREDLRGDFALGKMLQKTLEREVSRGKELSGATMLGNEESLIRQIEFSGGIGESIITYKDSEEGYESSPFLGFTLNSKQYFVSKNKDLKKMDHFFQINSENLVFMKYNDESFVQKSKELFKDGFKLTRIIKEGDNFNVIYERLV